MSFSSTYKKVFEVAIRHGFHLNKGTEEFDSLSAAEKEEALRDFDIRDDLIIVPTPDTVRELARLRMLFRTTPSGFFVGSDVTKSGNDYVPRVVPRAPRRLRFILQIKSAHFANFTSLKLGAERRLFYFSNAAGQSGGKYPYLSLPPDQWTSSTKFEAGDLTRRSAGAKILYLALENGVHGKPAANSNRWKKLSGRGYVSGTDGVALYPPIFDFVFPDDDVADATFTIISPEGDSTQVDSTAAESGSALISHRLDLENFEPGRYRLAVAGTDLQGGAYEHEEQIYVDPDLPRRRAFALVEIFHRDNNALGDYGLYNATKSYALRQPSYVIHFLNRHTYWRYIFAHDLEPGTHLGDLEKMGDAYVTEDAMPLTKSFLQVTYDGGKLLPNPSTAIIKPEDPRVYSDIHV